jgi:hypothetical protein
MPKLTPWLSVACANLAAAILSGGEAHIRLAIEDFAHATLSAANNRDPE